MWGPYIHTYICHSIPGIILTSGSQQTFPRTPPPPFLSPNNITAPGNRDVSRRSGNECSRRGAVDAAVSVVGEKASGGQHRRCPRRISRYLPRGDDSAVWGREKVAPVARSCPMCRAGGRQSGKSSINISINGIIESRWYYGRDQTWSRLSWRRSTIRRGNCYITV